MAAGSLHGTYPSGWRWQLAVVLMVETAGSTVQKTITKRLPRSLRSEGWLAASGTGHLGQVADKLATRRHHLQRLDQRSLEGRPLAQT